MLTHLSIKNYALIEYSSIDFGGNLSIITGETGAGKSILLDALGLVLGKRADLNALRNKEEKCIVEAHFSIAPYTLHALFNDLDLDYENETIIRREILPTGKSRAFVNDVPTTLQNLQQLGEVLIDIHTQHQTRDLFDEQYQLSLIDAYAGNTELLKAYQQQLAVFKKLKQQLAALKDDQSQAAKEYDYNTFLLDELVKAGFKEGEQEQLEGQFEVLNNVERVGGLLEQGYGLLTNEDLGITKQLYEAKGLLQKLAQISKDYDNLAERLESSFIELEDIADELQQKLQGLTADPHQLELLNQRLQLMYQLQKKHNAANVEELLDIQADLTSKVAAVENLDEALLMAEKQLAAATVKLDELAKAVSQKRTEVLEPLGNDIARLIHPLGMPNAVFNIRLEHTETFQNTGKDEVQWLFSANKGMASGLLKKTASGGELSRIMLAIKAIWASKSNLPTIVFDEIDTGVSGDVADKMGAIMKDMGQYMQIFAITHLPQVAAKGSQHFKVAKNDDADATVSEIKLLNREERIKEIAQMLSGKNITAAALQHAEQLLN